MKVRLFEDSVRIRLSQREVMDLGARRSLHGITRFSVGQLEIEVVPREGVGLEATFADNKLIVTVSSERASQWSHNDLEGLYSMSGPCKVALEKDYACLHKSGDANKGTFPNPLADSKLSK